MESLAEAYLSRCLGGCVEVHGCHCHSPQVPTTSLRRPKPHYMTLPAQAVRCRLAHLKPAGSVSVLTTHPFSLSLSPPLSLSHRLSLSHPPSLSLILTDLEHSGISATLPDDQGQANSSGHLICEGQRSSLHHICILHINSSSTGIKLVSAF